MVAASLIGLLIIFGILDDFFWYIGIGSLIEEVVMPLVMAGLIGYFVYRMVQKNMGVSTQKVKSTKTSSSSASSVKYSNKELKVAEKLKKYFAENDTLILSDTVTLRKTADTKDVFQGVSFFYQDLEVSTVYDLIKDNTETYNKLIEYLYLRDSYVKEVVHTEEVRRANYYIEKVNEYNVSIDHTDISNNLYITSSLLTALKNLEEQGLKIDDDRIRKVYQYYLPMLVEILETYCKTKDNYLLENQVKETEEKLVKVIDLTNTALKTTLSSINEEDIINLKINMSTLESVLKGDGLISELDKVKETVR